MHLHVDTECMSCPFALCCYFIGLKYSAPCRTRLRSSHKRRLVDCGFFSWLKLLRKPKRRNTTSAASATMLCGVEFKYPPMQCAPAIIEGQRVVKCYTASRCQHPSTRIRRVCSELPRTALCPDLTTTHSLFGDLLGVDFRIAVSRKRKIAPNQPKSKQSRGICASFGVCFSLFCFVFG